MKCPYCFCDFLAHAIKIHLILALSVKALLFDRHATNLMYSIWPVKKLEMRVSHRFQCDRKVNVKKNWNNEACF